MHTDNYKWLRVHGIIAMAQSSQLPDRELLANLDVRAVGIDEESDRFDWFLNKVAKAVGTMLKDNANHHRAPDNDVDSARDVFKTVLGPDNVDHVKIRDEPLSDARVTFWLTDCPLWANDADQIKLINTQGRNDCHVVIDVRPY